MYTFISVQVVQTLFLSVGPAAHTGTYINYIINILLKTNGKCKMHKMYMCSKNYYDRLLLSLLLFIFTYLLYMCCILVLYFIIYYKLSLKQSIMLNISMYSYR